MPSFNLAAHENNQPHIQNTMNGKFLDFIIPDASPVFPVHYISSMKIVNIQITRIKHGRRTVTFDVTANRSYAIPKRFSRAPGNNWKTILMVKVKYVSTYSLISNKNVANNRRRMH